MDRRRSDQGLNRERTLTAPRGFEISAALLAFVGLGLWISWATGGVLKADDYPAIAYASDLGRVAQDFVGPQYGLSFFLFWRPWITTSLSIDHALFGVDASGYLFMNALAFTSSVFLFWTLLRMLVPEYPVVAWVAAGMWLLHPAPVVSLHWVVGRVDTHAVLPMLAACVLHLRHRRRGGSARWPVWVAVVWSLASKESAIGLPFVLLGLDLLDRHPSLVRAPAVFGRALPALRYLLVLPIFFLWRKLILGKALGGYGFLALQDLQVGAVLDGLRQSLAQSIVPGASVLFANVTVGVLAGFVAYWSFFARPERRAVRVTGVLLVSAGIWAPLAQLLPSMRDPSQQRYAYAACLWSVLAWSGLSTCLASGVFRRRGRVRVTASVVCGVLPLALLVSERGAEVVKMRGHDQFCSRLVDAIDRVDAQLEGASRAIVVGGDAELVNHPQRFLWGLGAVHAPPFRRSRTEVVTLRRLAPYATPVTPEFAAAGLGAWIEVLSTGEIALRDAAPGARRVVRPVGFSGTLEAVDIERLAEPDAAIGYACAPDVDRVAVVTSVGSAMMQVAPRDGLLRLRDVLLSDVGWATGARITTPLLDLVLNPLDLAPRSPVFLIWPGEGATRHVAELRATRDFVRAVIAAKQ